MAMKMMNLAAKASQKIMEVKKKSKMKSKKAC